MARLVVLGPKLHGYAGNELDQEVTDETLAGGTLALYSCGSTGSELRDVRWCPAWQSVRRNQRVSRCPVRDGCRAREELRALSRQNVYYRPTAPKGVARLQPLTGTR